MDRIRWLVAMAFISISLNIMDVFGANTMDCISKSCLSSPGKAFGSCEGFKALVECIKKCPATKDGKDAWTWAVNDEHGPWNHVVKSMMSKCGITATTSEHPCLPNEPTDVFQHCWNFITYQECIKKHGLEEPQNSTWTDITNAMAEKCKPESSKLETLPKLKINVTKMAKVLENIATPSDWDACHNFHAYACEHSIRRPDRPKRSVNMLSEGEPKFFGMTDVKEVDAILEAKVKSMLDDVAAGKEWTGPSWVFKLLHVYNACSNNETADMCDFGSGVTAKHIQDYIMGVVTLYAAELEPGYQVAKEFTQHLMPLVRAELADIIKEWVGLGNTTALQDFIKNQLPVYIGLPPKFHQYMSAMTDDLKIYPNITTFTVYSFAGWIQRLSGLDMKIYTSGSFLVWNAFANKYTKSEAYFGGTLLVPPAFDLDLSYAFLFGDTLFVLFHELSHALEGAWLFVKGIKTSFYSYFKKCLIDEYGRHPIYFNGTKTLNGSFTYSENFADVIGFQLAWRIYQKYYKAFDIVPDKRFNRDQVMFLGTSANAAFCRKGLADMEKVEKMQLGDPHTTGENRLNLLLMQTPQFAREFGCATGTRMNPYKNCVKLMNIDNY